MALRPPRTAAAGQFYRPSARKLLTKRGKSDIIISVGGRPRRAARPLGSRGSALFVGQHSIKKNMPLWRDRQTRVGVNSACSRSPFGQRHRRGVSPPFRAKATFLREAMVYLSPLRPRVDSSLLLKLYIVIHACVVESADTRDLKSFVLYKNGKK